MKTARKRSSHKFATGLQESAAAFRCAVLRYAVLRCATLGYSRRCILALRCSSGAWPMMWGIAVCCLATAGTANGSWLQDSDAQFVVERAIRKSSPPWYNPQEKRIRPASEFVSSTESTAVIDGIRSNKKDTATPFVDWWSQPLKDFGSTLYDYLVGWWWPNSWNTGWSWWQMLLALLAILMLGLMVYLLLKLDLIKTGRLRGRPLDGVNKKRRSATVADLPFELEGEPLSLGDLLSRAKQARRQGNFRLAIIYLYSHLLLELDRKELITLSKGKTNRTYLQEIKSRFELKSHFQQMMSAFERSFFGSHPLLEEEIDRLFSQTDRHLAA